MKLPAQLTPWRDWLALLPAELAAPLGQMLLRLRPLLGRMAGFDPSHDSVPVGAGSIARRGSYERLLLSEWAVLNAAPDEFLRRAAAGELLFGAPEPQVQRRAHTCVVLFDAGPAQLGEPRLAHLALLILLARRSQDEGASLRWGVLQEPGLLHDDCTLEHLLNARTLERASRVMLDEWNRQLARLDPHAELWQVGAPGAPAFKRENARAAIEQPLLGNGLQVAITQQGRVRRLTLALPAPADGARLLRRPASKARHPFGRSSAALDLPSLKHPPQLALLYDQVVTGRANGATLSFRYKGSNPDNLGKPKRRRGPRRGGVLGICAEGYAIGEVSACGETLLFRGFGGIFNKHECVRPPPMQFTAPQGSGRWLPVFSLRAPPVERVLMVDAGARLVMWWTTTHGATASDFTVLASGVVGAAMGQDRLLFACVANGRTTLHRYDVTLAAPLDERAFDCAARRVLYGEIRNKSHACLLALQMSDTEWQLVDGDSAHVLPVDDGATVIGVARLARDDAEPALLVIAPDRRSVQLRGQSVRRSIVHATRPIAQLSMDSYSQIISWLLEESHELFVRRLHEETLLMHYQPVPDKPA